MKITVNGTISAVLAPKSGVSKVTGTEWKSQEFVLQEEDGTLICFNVFGEQKINQYALVVGKQVSVELEISAKEWQGRYFTGVNCTECYAKNITQANPKPQQQTQQPHPLSQPDPIYSPNPAQGAPVVVDADNLPF